MQEWLGLLGVFDELGAVVSVVAITFIIECPAVMFLKIANVSIVELRERNKR